MNVKEVEKLLTARPFEPFGIYMSDGSGYPVTHPDHVMLTPRLAHIGIGSSRNENDCESRHVRPSKVH